MMLDISPQNAFAYDKYRTNVHWIHKITYIMLIPSWLLAIITICCKIIILFSGAISLYGSDLSPPLRKPLPCLHLRPLEWPKLLLDSTCASGSAVDLMGLRSWFFNNSLVLSAITSIEINFEYLVKFLYLYCYWMILEVWNVEKVFSSI